MLQILSRKHVICLILASTVSAKFHKFIPENSTNVKYEDIFVYHDDTSTIKCLAICERQENCTSVNYNLVTRRCELTAYLPRIEAPASTTETYWRIYYNDRIITAKEAWQNSTYLSGNHAWLANYAIDGERKRDVYCAHTAEYFSFWAMEFEYVAEVDYVIVIFRYADVLNNRNKNLRLLISSTREDCDNNIGTDCATYIGPPATSALPVRIQCLKPVTGKFLKIIQDNPTFMTLCEVEVYSV